MKKIMFNDKFGLTQAVLEGRKTMTRRIIPPIEVDWNRRGKVTLPVSSFRSGVLFMDTGSILNDLSEYFAPTKYQPKYKVGEVVAVAQNYEDAGYARDTIQRAKFRTDKYNGWQIGDFEICLLPGWKNKMFVFPTMMPHQIRITNVRVERLKDISDEDCIREGIEEDSPYYWVPVNMSLPNWRKIVDGVSDMYPNDRDGKVYPHFWDSPRKAFAALIDKVSGKGTWESNPWVFVYEFELVR